MQITALKTPKLTPGTDDIYTVLDQALPPLQEGDIVAVTSKIVSICQGAVISLADANKDDLVLLESQLYLPHEYSKYGHHFTITRNTLISMAGIDESNGDGYYILWPRDAQQSANDIRKYLAGKNGLTDLGVVITDSTCMPLRRGTTGISLAHSGFNGLRNYIGQPDLFGEPLQVTQANLAGGMAAAAVLAMGEGAEQTPIALLRNVQAITFQDRDPNAIELAELYPTLDNDLFEPFLASVKWEKGKSGAG